MGMICPYCGEKFNPAVQGHSPNGDDYVRRVGADLASQQAGHEMGRRMANTVLGAKPGSLSYNAPTQLWGKDPEIWCSKKCFKEDTENDTPEEREARAAAAAEAKAARDAAAAVQAQRAEKMEPIVKAGTSTLKIVGTAFMLFVGVSGLASTIEDGDLGTGLCCVAFTAFVCWGIWWEPNG